MGIKTEYNPDLALRVMDEYRAHRRRIEECIPEPLEPGKTYEFLKKGQRVYWLEGEIPLLETKGRQKLSKPLASIIILEATHFLLKGQPYTKGLYEVVEVFNPNDDKIHFDGFAKI